MATRRARARTALRGKYRFWGGEAAAALPDLERAARLAHDAGNRAEEADSIQYICAAMRVGPTPVEKALRRVEEIGSGAAISARLEQTILVARALLMATLGDFDAARGFVSRAQALAEEHGLDGSYHLLSGGRIELLAGDAAAAERELRTVCEHFERIGELGFLSSAAYELADAVVAQGRDEEALGLTERWRADRLTVPEDCDAQAAAACAGKGSCPAR